MKSSNIISVDNLKIDSKNGKTTIKINKFLDEEATEKIRIFIEKFL